MANLQDLSDKDRARHAHILISLYEKLYKERHKTRPVLNRYSAKWGMMDVIDSVGVDRAGELLEFYFRTPHSQHDIEFFYRNFDKMDANEKSISDDRRRRAIIMEQTRQRVKEAGDQY